MIRYFPYNDKRNAFTKTTMLPLTVKQTVSYAIHI